MAVTYKSAVNPPENAGSMFSAGVSESIARIEPANAVQYVSENFVAYLPVWVRHLNSITAAAVLGAIVYWYLPKAGTAEGRVTRVRKGEPHLWMHKTAGELAEETGLNEKQVRDALKILEAKRVIEMAVGGAAGKRTTWIRILCAKGAGTIASREAVTFEAPATGVMVKRKTYGKAKSQVTSKSEATPAKLLQSQKAPPSSDFKVTSNTGVSFSGVTVSEVTGAHAKTKPFPVATGKGKPKAKPLPLAGGTPSPIAPAPSPKQTAEEKAWQDNYYKTVILPSIMGAGEKAAAA